MTESTTYAETTIAAVPAAIALAPEEHTRIRWGAVFGGAVASLGIWALLYAFGLAVGFSAVDPNDAGSLRASGIFTGVWGAIAPILALFVGGIIASRGAGVITKGSGALHGMVMWGLTTLLGAWAIANVTSTVVGGAISVGKTALAGAGGAVKKLAGNISIDADEVLAPVNARLRAEGKPAVSAAQLEAATRDVLRDAVRQGRLDRDTLARSVADNTALSLADADQIASRIERQFQQAKEKVGEGAHAAEQKALEAADVTGKAFWGVFGALFLGMLASLGGAALGGSDRMLAWSARSRIRALEHGVA